MTLWMIHGVPVIYHGLGLSEIPSEGNRTSDFTFFGENRTYIDIEKHDILYSAQHFDIALVEVHHLDELSVSTSISVYIKYC